MQGLPVEFPAHLILDDHQRVAVELPFREAPSAEAAACHHPVMPVYLVHASAPRGVVGSWIRHVGRIPHHNVQRGVLHVALAPRTTGDQ